MKVDVVIGSNYGDEGKGLFVDYLAAKNNNRNTVGVVRFNGGSQAGHTVTLTDGRRHVFSHFGAGTFAGASTILSKYFVVNPLTFFYEDYELQQLGVAVTEVIVSETAPVSTPIDVFINREVERQRGRGKHGSCGLGIGETIERVEAGYAWTVKDLQTSPPQHFLQHLKSLRDVYALGRLKHMGCSVDDSVYDRLQIECSDDALQLFCDVSQVFLYNVSVRPDAELLKGFDRIIFEGAQGLLLDMDYGQFPYVTRSNTGLKNVRTILSDTGMLASDTKVWYMTRAYMTRHGAGPLEDEDKLNNAVVVDSTNVPNEWQGSLRTAPLRVDSLTCRTATDFYNYAPPNASINLVVTCCDQVQDYAAVINSANHTNVYQSVWWSDGPTREDVRCKFVA